MDKSGKFDQCAIVELFGRKIIAGRVTEEVIGAQGFVRVDVPAIDDQAAYVKFYGPGAIYCITPCTEETMLEVLAGLKPKPIELWSLNIPRLPQFSRDEDARFDDDLDGPNFEE